MALDVASESTGMFGGYLPTLSIPSVSSFTGWLPSFSGGSTPTANETQDGFKIPSDETDSASLREDTKNEWSMRPPSSAKITSGVNDIRSYVGLQRLLVELISENVKMRTQLNHYSEALIMPALEKDKEFRRQFQEAEVEKRFEDSVADPSQSQKKSRKRSRGRKAINTLDNTEVGEDKDAELTNVWQLYVDKLKKKKIVSNCSNEANSARCCGAHIV